MRSISVQTVDSDGEDGQSDNGDGTDGGTPPKVLVTALAGAVVVGGIAAYATSNINIYASAGAFVVFAALAGYHLSNKDVPAEAAGSTSYISAVLVLFTPFALYISSIVFQGLEVSVIGAQAQDVQGSNVSIGGGSWFSAGAISLGNITSGTIDSIIALVIWVVLAIVVALVLIVVGRSFKAIAKKQEG
ncbi:MAG: hypothetical protein ACOCRA_04165 [Halobacteria archaeon]